MHHHFMVQSEYPTTVTLVAAPPADVIEATTDPFIDAALATLAGKHTPRHVIAEVSSVRDVDLKLSGILADRVHGRIRVQIIGHTLSGGLALGASWMQQPELSSKALKFPYYILDTNPESLGLLSKHAGKISEVMLVGCYIGSATHRGHAINGRTLTYTLAELLRCDVLGADDVIAPDEFDDRGWYTPRPRRHRAKGWRWIDGAPPSWTESGAAGSALPTRPGGAVTRRSARAS